MTVTTKTLSARFASVCSCGCRESYPVGTEIARGERGWIIVGHNQAWGTATERQLEIIGRQASERLADKPELMKKFARRYGELVGNRQLSSDKAVEILDWLMTIERPAEIEPARPAYLPEPAKAEPKSRVRKSSRPVRAARWTIADSGTLTNGSCACGMLHRRDVACF
jgi:hypothetical protein